MGGYALHWSTRLLSRTMTIIAVVTAVAAAALIYQYYVSAPWTRDGRVRVLVANVAPQISGQIVELRVDDNQVVHKGDILYVIDPFDYRMAVDSAHAEVQSSAADLQVKKAQAERRNLLTSLAASVEEKQQFTGSATVAVAAFQRAQTQLAQAEVNLKRTNVRSPVNGYVTNLTLRVGDYASTGMANLSIVDSDSFWIDGYFEETKLGSICVGDMVDADLMGYARPLVGHVESFGRGISVSDATSSVQGLPAVNPVYTWVRLAQRVPVRVHIDSIPTGLILASGLTTTVRVRAPGSGGFGAYVSNTKAEVLAFLHLILPLDRTCSLPAETHGGTITRLPIELAEPPLTPQQINPWLAPGIDDVPKRGLDEAPRKTDLSPLYGGR